MARCSLCNDLEKRDEDDARLAFEFTPNELANSAYEGRCDGCTVILEGLRQLEGKGFGLRTDVRKVYAKCHGRRKSYTETLCLEVYFADDRPKFELEFYSLQPHAWKAVFPRPSISGHPLSRQALTWVRSLLDTCRNTHTSCQDVGQAQLPKRVLSVHDHGREGLFIKLVEPGGEYDSYIALSHCWGREQTCTTVKENLWERKKGIPWDSVPKTFQDAIQFTLQLGMRYIWIDSLCIVQDDEMDWEIESSKMADIYQYASLTLAATASRGDSFGCFQNTPRRIDALEVHIPVDVGACRIAVRRQLKHWDTLNSNQTKRHFPLLSRGWAFQERLLSPRVLHFCEAELVWECRQVSTCECGSLGQGNSPGGSYYNAIQDSEVEGMQHATTQQELLDKTIARQLQQQEDDWELALRLQNEDCSSFDLGGSWAAIPPSNSFLRSSSAPSPLDLTYEPVVPQDKMKGYFTLVPHFHRIVEQYSALGLTKQTDRLPALSGLCKRVQHLRGDYFAGLWADSICFDLMWRVNTMNLDTCNSGRPIEYRGPSWSWVSVASTVSYWSDITDFGESTNIVPLGCNVDTIKAHINLPGRNPFGTVNFAILKAQASSTTARLLYTYDSYWHGQTNKHDPTRYKLEINTPCAYTASGTVEIPFFADYALGVQGRHQVPEGEVVTLLLVHPKVSLVLWRKSPETVQSIDNASKGTWERIGIARISENLWDYYRVDWMRASSVERFLIR